jgi:hypothetical protein
MPGVSRIALREPALGQRADDVDLAVLDGQTVPTVPDLPGVVQRQREMLSAAEADVA